MYNCVLVVIFTIFCTVGTGNCPYCFRVKLENNAVKIQTAGRNSRQTEI